MIILQGEKEKELGVYYQFDPNATPIGEGGMGRVHIGQCINTVTGAKRQVAIKCIYDDLPPHILERARRESSVQLRNDNLVEMLGYVQTTDKYSDGTIQKHAHVISELLTGVSLDQLMQSKTKDRNGNDVEYANELLQMFNKNPESFARIVITNVLSGVMALHDAHFIHRDIDPSNVMITNDRHIKLIDFGIAKQINNLTTNDRGLTVAGKFVGKPEYAAPELVLGDLQHQNQTTDIYAIGILLFQLITGHTPFHGAHNDILTKQLHEKIPLNEIKDKSLRNIIEKACEKNQSKRYQSCAEMRVALEQSLSSESSTRMLDKVKQNINVLTPLQKKMAIAIASALIAILLALIVTPLWNYSDEENIEQIADISEQNNTQYADSVKNEISKYVAQARKAAAIGYKHDEGYVDHLIEAKKYYNTVEKKIKILKEYGINCDDYASEIASLDNAISKAYNEIQEKADAMRNNGEDEYAKEFQKQADNISTYLKSNK